MKNLVIDDEETKHSRRPFELDFSSRWVYRGEENFDSYHFLMSVQWGNVALEGHSVTST